MKHIDIKLEVPADQVHLDVLINAIHRDMKGLKVSKQAMDRIYTAASILVNNYNASMIDPELLETVCTAMAKDPGAVYRDTLVKDGVMYPVPATDEEVAKAYEQMRELPDAVDLVFASNMALVTVTISNTLLPYLV